MKKLAVLVLGVFLIAAICVGALTEELEVEYDLVEEQAIGAEVLSAEVDQAVPEAESDLSGDTAWEKDSADSVGDKAVSAAEGVKIDADHFPDDTFREYVKWFDTNNDGALSSEECGEVTYIELFDYDNITDLKGIELFRNIERIRCPENKLKSLDVSGCTALVEIDCMDNQLTSLNVSGCTALWTLWCGGNQLKSLDVSSCTALMDLSCGDNQLTSLDVSKCKELSTLLCGGNQLTSLDISKNSKLDLLSTVENQLETIKLDGCTELIKYSMESPVIDGDVAMYGYHDEFDAYSIRVDKDTRLVVEGPINLREATITVKDQIYTGKALKPSVTGYFGKKKLKKDTDYTVSYTSNKAIGKATVTVNGKGKFSGTVKKAFRINPKAVKGLKLKADTNQITVTWNKDKKVTGYEIQYALNKDFSGAKKITITKAATVKNVIKKLKSNKTYYVRIRGYKTVKKVKYVSAWSKVLKVTTKK